LLNLEAKKKAVEDIKARLEKANTVVLTDYRGLNVAEITELRNKLRAASIEFKVAKNTLTKIAAKDIGLEGLDLYLEGPTAMAFSVDDPVAPAKILFEFAKTHKALQIKAGILENKVIDEASVNALADLPPREILLAQVLGAMQSPMYGFVGAMQGVLRKFVYALDAVREKKAAEA
jgi:large subunit ribosomal protein L10